MSPVRVLFLCKGNPARSIIGAALLKKIGGDVFEVHSAGTDPGGINPDATRALKDANIDVSGQRSQNVSEYEGQDFDYVITVCDSATAECPVFAGNPKLIHWMVSDPAAAEGSGEDKLNAFRRTLRGLKTRIPGFATVAKRVAISKQQSPAHVH